MARLQLKKLILSLALGLHSFALLLLLLSFVTPYWLISWPRVFSGFRKIGLWEVCFAGFRIQSDPSMKSYHGCWWILSPELYGIRSYIMPPWFIVIQILMSISVVIELIALIFLVRIWIRSESRDNTGIGKRRAPFNLVQGSTYITIITCCLKSISVIMFGLAYYYDPFWVRDQVPVNPGYEVNYPHVSFGLAICSTFFSIFSSIAHRVYRNIVRSEYLQPLIKESTISTMSLYDSKKQIPPI